MRAEKEPRVVVVGGGIIGLTSALALLESGYTRVHIVAESFDENVSLVAGAIWMPFALPASMSPDRPRKWCEASMAWLTKIWQQHGEQATGIHFVKGVDVASSDARAAGRPYWSHCVKNFRMLSAQEAAQVCPGSAHGYAFETIIYHPATLMKWVRTQIENLGGTFETRRLTSLDEVACDVLVNCTGLGARELVDDASAYPIRGQTIKVFNPKIKDFTNVSHGNSLHTYILPRPGGEVVLGGTVQPRNGNTANDERDVRAIWERCCLVNPEVRNSKVLGHAAGLRPGRTEGVRVELDSLRTARGARVIHNYAHSGSGHTLQWGCAQDVVQIATQQCPPTAHSQIASRL